MAARLAGAAPRRLPGGTLIVTPAVTLAVMLWGIGARPYWGDEQDTVSAVSRTLPQLFRLLGHIDAVHGLYYLLLWPLAQVAGTGDLATRLPSALAMAAAAGGVSAIGRRLASGRAGLWAGLVFAVLPTVTVQGQDARPYAMVTAAAVLASYLLIRAAADPRPGWLAGYGLALVLTGYLQLFALLLVPAHAITLAALARQRPARQRPARQRPARQRPARQQPARQRPAGPGPVTASGPLPGHGTVLVRRWLVTVAAAGVVMAPLAVISYAQRAQVAWIPKPGWTDAGDLSATLMAASVPATLLITGLCLTALLAGSNRGDRWLASPRLRPLTHWWLRNDRPGRRLAWLAVPWLLLPPFLLLAASFAKPVYNGRYLTFCLPAVALLAGAGLATMRWQARVGVLALIAVLITPAQLARRVPGGGLQAAAQFLSAHEQPGDAIVYPASLTPPLSIAFPDGFAQLRDISQNQTPGAAGRLYGTTVPLPVLLQREEHVTRIWMVIQPGDRNPAGYLAPGFRLAGSWQPGGQQVLLYTTARSRPGVPAHPRARR